MLCSPLGAGYRCVQLGFKFLIDKVMSNLKAVEFFI